MEDIMKMERNEGEGSEASFVEIPMTGENGGTEGKYPIAGLRTSGVQNAGTEKKPVRRRRREKRAGDPAAFQGPGQDQEQNPKIRIQAGSINLYIYDGIQESALHTVMKAVMGYA